MEPLYPKLHNKLLSWAENGVCKDVEVIKCRGRHFCLSFDITDLPYLYKGTSSSRSNYRLRTMHDSTNVYLKMQSVATKLL